MVFVPARPPRESCRRTCCWLSYGNHTTCFSFLSFPLLSNIPALRLSSAVRLLYRKQEGLYILSAFLVNTLSFFFLTFFSSFLRRKLSFRRALLGRNGNHSITQHKNCQYLFVVFFSFFAENQRLCCGAFQRQRIRNIQQHFHFVKQFFFKTEKKLKIHMNARTGVEGRNVRRQRADCECALANPGTPENWKAVEPPSGPRQIINSNV